MAEQNGSIHITPQMRSDFIDQHLHHTPQGNLIAIKNFTVVGSVRRVYSQWLNVHFGRPFRDISHHEAHNLYQSMEDAFGPLQTTRVGGHEAFVGLEVV